jgi:drug/metabolite transporter (DMT)-like permease
MEPPATHAHPPDQHGRATLALLACVLLWSLNGVAIKLLSGDARKDARPATASAAADREKPPDVAPLALACYRSLVGGIVLLPLAWPSRRTLGNVAPLWPLLGVAAFTLMSATFVIANTLTAAANAILLQYTSPVWVFLLAPAVLGERIRRADWIVLAVTMVGLAVVFGGNVDSGVGLAIALVSGFGYGAVTVMSRKLRAVHPIVVTTLYALGSGVALLPAVLALNLYRATPGQLVAICALGLVQFTLPYLLFSWALQRTTAARAALITLLEAAFNPLWTWLFLSEQPPLATLLGAPLILGGVITKILSGAGRSAPPRAPAAEEEAA